MSFRIRACDFVCWLVLGLTASFLGGAAHALENPPNILLVIADDMGVDASPCYPVGELKPNMPILEELCSTGVVFENVWSNPECSPTRATILTGRYGIRTGVRSAVLETGGSGIRLDELSIQRLLDQRLNSKYAHAVIGKWHLSDGNNGGLDNAELMGVGHYSGLIKYGHEDYWKELCRNMGDGADQAASFVGVAMTATPSVNVIPSTTLGN
jgi:arylsulfatase A-like enzyme